MNYLKTTVMNILGAIIWGLGFSITQLVVAFGILKYELTPWNALIGCIYSFGLGVLVFALLKVIIAIVKNKKRGKLQGLLESKGYCDEYYDKLRAKLPKKGTSKGISKKLWFATELAKGQRNDEALEIIKSIDLEKLSGVNVKEYYTAYLFVLVMTDETESADVILKAGCDNFTKDFYGYLALGCYHYSKENYPLAVDMCERAYNKAKNTIDENFALLFLALYNSKAGNLKLSKEIATELIQRVKEPSQVDMLKDLMKIIEIKSLEKDKPNEEDNTEDYAGSVD